jgi:hypothetical protein
MLVVGIQRVAHEIPAVFEDYQRRKSVVGGKEKQSQFAEYYLKGFEILLKEI